MSKNHNDNPEWTNAMLRDAKRGIKGLADLIGEEAANGIAKAAKRGRPKVEHPKVNATLRLSQDVLDAYKNSGPGWQVKIDNLLREHMPH